MIQALLRRGHEGTFRSDISADEPLFLLGRLLEAPVRMVAEHQAGVEKAAAPVTSVFRHGTANPLRRGQSIPFLRNQNWLIGTRRRADPRSPTATK